MLFRIGARTVAAAGAVTVVGVLAAPALAATTVSQATAQSLKLSIAGTPAVTQIITASNDGTKQSKNNASTLPTLAQVLPTNNLLGAGVAPQDAGANADGTSFACAGIAGTGGGIIHTGNTSCAINGAPITIGLGDLNLGSTTLDTSSAIGAALNGLGLGTVVNGLVNGVAGNIVSSVSNALKGTTLDIKLGGTLSAIEGVCQATPTSATGATHLVDTQGNANAPTPIQATIAGKTLVIAQLPANPPVNTHVLVGLSTVTQTVIDAVKVELNNAVGGALANLGLGTALQQVQDAIVAQLVTQLQPLLQPLQANVLDITLNKQASSDGGKRIDVTALDLQVLPAAAQFTGGHSLIGGQLGLVSCGPNTKPSNNNGGGNNGGGNNGGGNNGGTPGNPTVIPTGVDAGLVGHSDNIALTAALSGTALAAAAGLGLYYRRLAAR